MSFSVKRDLTSEVKNLCDTTATDDVSSADEVWDFYCSAVEDLVVAEVTESISQTLPTGTAESRTGSGDSNPSETGKGNSESESDGEGGGGTVNKTAVIVGSVLGGVIGIALIIGIAFFIRRKKKKARNEHGGTSSPSEYSGVPELHDTGSNSGVPIGKVVNGGDTHELPSDERRQELQAHSHSDHLIPFHKPHEMDGTTDQRSTESLQNRQQSRDGGSPPDQVQQGIERQSGPTETYYEMDSTPVKRP